MARPNANMHILAQEVLNLAAQLEQVAASEKWSETSLVISTLCANVTRMIGNLADIDKTMADQLTKQIAAEHFAVFGEFANVTFNQVHPHGYPESLKTDQEKAAEGGEEEGAVATSPPE